MRAWAEENPVYTINVYCIRNVFAASNVSLHHLLGHEHGGQGHSLVVAHCFWQECDQRPVSQEMLSQTLVLFLLPPLEYCNREEANDTLSHTLSHASFQRFNLSFKYLLAYYRATKRKDRGCASSSLVLPLHSCH